MHTVREGNQAFNDYNETGELTAHFEEIWTVNLSSISKLTQFNENNQREAAGEMNYAYCVCTHHQFLFKQHDMTDYPTAATISQSTIDCTTAEKKQRA